MWKYIFTIFTFGLYLSAQVQAENRNDKNKQPNILFITVDDMNDWVGAFGGHPQAITPNIDKLAEKGTVFHNAYCSAALCNPSRASIMTGLSPSTTGVFGNAEIIREQPGFADVITLPQYFEKYGYNTLAAGKIFHSPRGNGEKPTVHSEPGSFQIERKGGVGAKAPPMENRLQTGLDYSLDYATDGYVWEAFDWYGSDEKTEDTEDWKNADFCAEYLDEAHEKPFFLACGIFRPHLPWYAPKKYFDMYKIEDIVLPKVLENDLDDVGAIAAGYLNDKLHKVMREKGLWQEGVRAYLANLTFADICVGHVLDALENSEYANNTIVVLLGDHGWHLGEKLHWTKQTLWEEAAKAPLIVYDPRQKNGGDCKRIVSFLDIYPTLVELCDLPQKEDLEGTSFKSLITNPNRKWKRLAMTVKDSGNYSLRSENYRYSRYKDGFEELYDHRVDPMEWNNVAGVSAKKKL